MKKGQNRTRVRQSSSLPPEEISNSNSSSNSSGSTFSNPSASSSQNRLMKQNAGKGKPKIEANFDTDENNNEDDDDREEDDDRDGQYQGNDDHHQDEEGQIQKQSGKSKVKETGYKKQNKKVKRRHSDNDKAISTTYMNFRNRKSAGDQVFVKEKRTVRKYCICQQPYNRDEFYIQCDNCDEWFHGKCVFLSESLGDQIEQWFCPRCVAKKKLEIKWKPECARAECSERVRTDNIYCSDQCASLEGTRKLNEHLSKLPSLRKNRRIEGENDPYRASLVSALFDISISRQKMERIIRCLEFRQRLIDECVDRSIKYGLDHPEAKICGFDERIVTEWIPSSKEFLRSFDSLPLEEYFVSLKEISPSSPGDMSDRFSKIDGFNDTVCKNGEKCIFHESWQLMKSREVSLELYEQIKTYCLKRQQEVELTLRILPKKVALSVEEMGVIV